WSKRSKCAPCSLCRGCTPFPPMCRKCAKMCRRLKTEKSHEESCDSSWDFGALVGTRIPGPLIKSQMLYRLSYERITIFVFCAAGYRPIILPHPGAKCKCRRKKVCFSLQMVPAGTPSLQKDTK